MELHLKIIGLLLIALAGIHLAFPSYFEWQTQFKSLSTINRQMMYVHTFFIALVVLLMGILCISSAAELINTSLGNKIALGFCVFWSARLLIQFFGYSTELWRGKKLETFIHILFSFLWLYFSVVFLLVSLQLFHSSLYN